MELMCSLYRTFETVIYIFFSQIRVVLYASRTLFVVIKKNITSKSFRRFMHNLSWNFQINEETFLLFRYSFSFEPLAVEDFLAGYLSERRTLLTSVDECKSRGLLNAFDKKSHVVHSPFRNNVIPPWIFKFVYTIWKKSSKPSWLLQLKNY